MVVDVVVVLVLVEEVDVEVLVVLVVVVKTSPLSEISQCFPFQPSLHSHSYFSTPKSLHFPNSEHGSGKQSLMSTSHFAPCQPIEHLHLK